MLLHSERGQFSKYQLCWEWSVAVWLCACFSRLCLLNHSINILLWVLLFNGCCGNFCMFVILCSILSFHNNFITIIFSNFLNLSSFRIDKTDKVYSVEKSLQNLLHKAGDTAARNRDDAKNFIYEMANFPEVKVSNCHSFGGCFLSR